MASEVRTFTVTIPSGTPAANPQVTPLVFPPRIVREIEAVIPGGCNGLVGFAFGAAGRSVIPFNDGGWIIGSGEIVKWPIEGQIDSGAWEMRGYNTGLYPHTIQVRFLLDYVSSGNSAATPPLIPDGDLSSMPPDLLANMSMPSVVADLGF